MLLQFAVENFACFAAEALFSMVAKADEEHADHIVRLEAGQKAKALRIAALYGANAHGKTKLIEALRFARHVIVAGTKSSQAIPVAPFRLDAAKIEAPSRFDFLIEYQGVEYSYGFVLDSKRVHEEWLFARPNSREVKYFERVTDTEGKVTVDAGRSLAGRTKKEQQFIEFIAQGTRPNQLFLTEAVDRNVSIFKPLFEWFSDVLTIISANARYQPLEVRAYKEDEFLGFMAGFLRKAGTGIESIETVQEELDYDKHMPNLSDNLKEKIESDIAEGHIVAVMGKGGATFSLCQDESGIPALLRLKTVHTGRDGTQAKFDFEEESAGTQRLMEILPMLADVRTQEKVYVIDELDRKLHPLLTRFFINTYLQQCEGEERGQLIFTTHDSNLLDLELLRRDEIWFLQKDKYGASKLYSLADLKVRSDLKISKGYLNGRFGGVPLIRDIELPCEERNVQ